MANVITPEFRVSWPKVLKPELNKLSNKEEYSVQALFPKGTDLSKLKAAAKAATEAKWGTDSAKWPKNLRLPFKEQTETRVNLEGKTVANPGHVNGAVYLSLKSTQKPGVVDQNVQPIMSESDFYSGCWAIASINAKAYDQAGNRGISFYLQNIQKTKEGDPLTGRMKPETEFAAIAGTEDGAANTNDMFS
jgi:hypothetical protein